MFGLFGKQELENGTFNNTLIASLGESVRRESRLPTEEELLDLIASLIGNKKLTASQVNSARLCAVTCEMESFGDEIRPLIKEFQKELPQGGHENYDKIIELLSRRAIIVTDEQIAFAKQYGLKM